MIGSSVEVHSTSHERFAMKKTTSMTTSILNPEFLEVHKVTVFFGSFMTIFFLLCFLHLVDIIYEALHLGGKENLIQLLSLYDFWYTYIFLIGSFWVVSSFWALHTFLRDPKHYCRLHSNDQEMLIWFRRFMATFFMFFLLPFTLVLLFLGIDFGGILMRVIYKEALLLITIIIVPFVLMRYIRRYKKDYVENPEWKSLFLSNTSQYATR